MRSGQKQIKCKKLMSYVIIVVMLVSLLVPAGAKEASAAAKPEFTEKSRTLFAGDTCTLKIKNKISGASYHFKSSNSSIATVSKAGVVTGLKKGTVIIGCSIKKGKENYTLKCKINIRIPARAIEISNKTDYLMAGQTYDLNRLLTPSGSNDITTWKSSDPSVVKIDKKGNITAVKTGSAIITAVTTSGVSDSYTVYVVENKEKVVTKSDVIDGKVMLGNNSYGNLIIDNSVGDAKIELTGVIVGGTLIMESGAAYTVATNECTINKVSAVNEYGIASMSVDENTDSKEKTPSLVAGKGSLIVTIDSECNISVKQTNGATIESFSVVTKEDGSISIALEGFTGDLFVDSQSQSNIQIEATACEMASATIKSASEGQQITLTDTNAGTDKASTIQSVNLASNAALTVNVKTQEVNVAKEAEQADIVIKQPVTKLTNEGNNTSLVINSEVSELTSTGNASAVSLGDAAKVNSLSVSGADTNVELQKGAQVTTVTSSADNTRVVVAEGSAIQKVVTYGDSSSVEGTGKVEEAVVTGSDSKINTIGTEVKVAQGTSNVTVNGVEVKEEDKVAIATPSPTPTPVPKATATPAPKASVTPKATVTPKPTPKPTATPIPSSDPVGPYNPIPTSTPIPSDKEIVNNIIVAANQDKSDLIYQNLVSLYDKKLAQTGTVEDTWKQYDSPKNSKGEVNIDKGYCLSLIKAKLKPLSEKRDDFYINSKLYDYVKSGSAATTAQLDAAIGDLVDVTGESQIWFVTNYNEIKPMVNGLMDALIKQDAGSTYKYLTDITAYMKQKNNCNDSVLQGDTYAADYMKMLREVMLSGDSNRIFSVYYELYIKFTGNDYSRYISECANQVMWSVTWWCSPKAYPMLFAERNIEKRKAQIDAVIDALPQVTVHTWKDSNNVEHFDYAEYDREYNKAAILAAIKAMCTDENIQYIYGWDAKTFTVDPRFEYETIYEIIRKVYTEGTYDDGTYEMLNYYLKNRASLGAAPDENIIHECVAGIICGVKDVYDWNVSYLEKYKGVTDTIIKAVNDNDETALYNNIVKLYQSKLADDTQTIEEWKTYDKPYDDKGAQAIDKTYCMKVLKARLQPLSDEKDGKAVNSELYTYVQSGSSASGDLLDKAIYNIKDAVWESQLSSENYYKEIKGKLKNIIDTALDGSDEYAVYDALTAIKEFMESYYGVKNAVLKDKNTYAVVYNSIIRKMMLDDGWNNENNDLRKYFDIYQTLSGDDYSRWIADAADKAMWNILWLLQGSEDAEKCIQEMYDLHYKIAAIQENIEKAVYGSVTDAERIAAFEALLVSAKADNEFISNYFSDISDFSAVTFNPENLPLYLSDINKKLTDDTMDSDDTTGESWYRYGCYIYNQDRINGNPYRYNTIERTQADFIRSIIDVNNQNADYTLQLPLLQELAAAVKAGDAGKTYTALKNINNYFATQLNNTDTAIQSETYSESYLWEINNMDASNSFCYFVQNCDSIGSGFTAENAENCNAAIYNVQGSILSGDANEFYTNRYGKSDIYKPDLDKIIDIMVSKLTIVKKTDENGVEHIDRVDYNLTDSEKAEVMTALDNILDNTVFSAFGLSPFILNTEYEEDFLSGIAYSIGCYEPNSDGSISYLYDYANNRDTMSESKAMMEISQCVCNLLYTINDTQNYFAKGHDILDGILLAAANNDAEAAYNKLTALYDWKLSGYNAAEWSGYENPYNDSINKEYALTCIKNMLASGSESDPGSCALYKYSVDPLKASGFLIENALLDLKVIVYESNKQIYDTYQAQKTMITGLVTATVTGSAIEVYQYLTDINNYYNNDLKISSTLLGPEYQDIYLDFLRSYMNPENDNKFKEFYQMQLGFTGGEYSRYIAETANGAVSCAGWFLTGDRVKQVEDEYISRNPQ